MYVLEGVKARIIVAKVKKSVYTLGEIALL